MDPEVKEAAEQATADDRRSLASLIEVLLVKLLQREGAADRGRPGTEKGQAVIGGRALRDEVGQERLK
jgi:hypothetical protein